MMVSALGSEVSAGWKWCSQTLFFFKNLHAHSNLLCGNTQSYCQFSPHFGTNSVVFCADAQIGDHKA